MNVPLSPDRLRAFTAALEAAIERARRSGRAELCYHRASLDDAPSGLDVYRQAETQGERRFFAARPARGFELVAVGAAERATASGDDPFRSLARQVADVSARDASEAWWVGGIAFDPAPPGGRAACWQAFGSASFVLPELTLVRSDGALWLALAARVSGDTRPEAILGRLGRWLAKCGLEGAPPAFGAPRRTIASSLAYQAAVARTLCAIHEGRAEKVVLAREDLHTTRPGWRPSRALGSLLRAHPDCTTFAQGIGGATFLGATPELLVRRSGLRVETAAVAATAPRDASAHAEARLARELCSSGKERVEHAVVVDAIASQLAPACASLEVPQTPRVLLTGSLQHLYTPITGTLLERVHVLELARRLHPTPALGGHPRPAALDLIRAHEGLDRGWYAGPIGWIDARGDGELSVALRCALARRGELRLFAGSGLVHDSDVERETQETGLKLRSILEALEPA